MNVYFQTEALHYNIKAGLYRYVDQLSTEIQFQDHDKIVFVDRDSKNGVLKKIKNLVLNIAETRLMHGSEYDLCHLTAMHYEPVRANKYCATIHDLLVLSHPHYFRSLDRYLFKKYINQILKAGNFICVSKATADDLMQRFSVHHRQIEVIYHGLSNQFYNDPDDSVLKKYNIKRPFIMFCSTIEPRKNLEFLINVYEHSGLCLKYDLVVVGKMGWMCNYLTNRLTSNPLIKYLGFICDDDIRRLYSTTILYINPSSIEGVGMPIIEAQNCGANVLCSDIKVFREIGGIFVSYFQVNDAKDLANKVEISIKEGRKEKPGSEQFNKQFSWESAASKTLSYYKKLLK